MTVSLQSNLMHIFRKIFISCSTCVFQIKDIFLKNGNYEEVRFPAWKQIYTPAFYLGFDFEDFCSRFLASSFKHQ